MREEMDDSSSKAQNISYYRLIGFPVVATRSGVIFPASAVSSLPKGGLIGLLIARLKSESEKFIVIEAASRCNEIKFQHNASKYILENA